jgi:hypothetical protein
MSNSKIPKQTEILAIRMNPQLLNQLNALAIAKHMGTATMARAALIDYLKSEAPNALLGASATPQAQPFNKPKPAITKPSERIDWNDPDQVRQMKAMQEQREAQQKAKTEAYLEALRNGKKPAVEDDWDY